MRDRNLLKFSRKQVVLRCFNCVDTYEIRLIVWFREQNPNNYIKDNLNMNFNNPRKFWRTLKCVFHENNMNNDIVFIDPDTNVPITKDIEWDFLNKYFVEIG